MAPSNFELVNLLVPKFYGQQELFLSWFIKVEEAFENLRLDELEKMEIVVSKLRNHALTWWTIYKMRRKKRGKANVHTWEKLRGKLLRKFGPFQYKTHPSKTKPINKGSLSSFSPKLSAPSSPSKTPNVQPHSPPQNAPTHHKNNPHISPTVQPSLPPQNPTPPHKENPQKPSPTFGDYPSLPPQNFPTPQPSSTLVECEELHEEQEENEPHFALSPKFDEHIENKLEDVCQPIDFELPPTFDELLEEQDEQEEHEASFDMVEPMSLQLSVNLHPLGFQWLLQGKGFQSHFWCPKFFGSNKNHLGEFWSMIMTLDACYLLLDRPWLLDWLAIPYGLSSTPSGYMCSNDQVCELYNVQSVLMPINEILGVKMRDLIAQFGSRELAQMDSPLIDFMAYLCESVLRANRMVVDSPYFMFFDDGRTLLEPLHEATQIVVELLGKVPWHEHLNITLVQMACEYLTKHNSERRYMLSSLLETCEFNFEPLTSLCVYAKHVKSVSITVPMKWCHSICETFKSGCEGNYGEHTWHQNPYILSTKQAATTQSAQPMFQPCFHAVQPLFPPQTHSVQPWSHSVQPLFLPQKFPQKIPTPSHKRCHARRYFSCQGVEHFATKIPNRRDAILAESMLSKMHKVEHDCYSPWTACELHVEPLMFLCVNAKNVESYLILVPMKLCYDISKSGCVFMRPSKRQASNIFSPNELCKRKVVKPGSLEWMLARKKWPPSLGWPKLMPKGQQW